MKRRGKWLWLSLFLSSGVFLPFANAQNNAPKYSNEFLNLGVGARSFGMSRAQVAVTKDASSGYWNPAGLVAISSDYEGILMHSEFFSGIAKYDYLGFAMKLDTVSSLGISVLRFGVDDIPDTRFIYDANGALNYDNVNFFSAADYAFLISYARHMPFLKGLTMGANIKVIYRNVGSFADAWGFGIDIGAQYSIKSWDLGVMFRDITGTFTNWSHNAENLASVYTQTGNQIPESTLEITLPKFIIGVGRRFVVKENWGVLPTIDLISTFDGQRNVLLRSNVTSLEPAVGLEADYKKVAYLRLGLGNLQYTEDLQGNESAVVQPSAGMGVRLNQVDVDYALTDFGADGDGLYTHVFSLTIRLTK